MPKHNVLDTLRTLTEAAAKFEKVAAHHQRIETERKALQEAITDAQLVLSVEDATEKKPSGKASASGAKILKYGPKRPLRSV